MNILTFPQQQEEKIKVIDFNDRKTLLDLIDFTRKAGAGYGITAILENFLNDKLRNNSLL